jgi:hypothetical protein
MLGFSPDRLLTESVSGQCGDGRCLTLSIHHPRQGEPPPSNLSSRPERSVAEGPAVCVDGKTEAGDSPTAHSLVPESGTAGPSVGMTNLRAAVHLHGWRWMDRTSTTVTKPVSLARVLFNAFTRLRRPKGRCSAPFGKLGIFPSHGTDGYPTSRSFFARCGIPQVLITHFQRRIATE